MAWINHAPGGGPWFGVFGIGGSVKGFEIGHHDDNWKPLLCALSRQHGKLPILGVGSSAASSAADMRILFKRREVRWLS